MGSYMLIFISFIYFLRPKTKLTTLYLYISLKYISIPSSYYLNYDLINDAHSTISIFFNNNIHAKNS